MNLTAYRLCIEALNVSAILIESGRTMVQYFDADPKYARYGVPGLHECLKDNVNSTIGHVVTAPINNFNYLQKGPNGIVYSSPNIDLQSIFNRGFDLNVEDADEQSNDSSLLREYDHDNLPDTISRNMIINFFKKNSPDCNAIKVYDWTCGHSTLTDTCNSVDGNPAEQWYVKNMNDFEVNYRGCMLDSLTSTFK